jgi:DNA-binding beta-propeller fold protein YncE
MKAPMLFLFTLLVSAALFAAPKPGPLIGFQRLFELSGPEDSPMSMPTDIAIGLNEQIYIVDSGNNRVLCYAKDGQFLFAFGSPGEGEGQLLAPVGITTATDGSVFVADRGNNRIQIFDEKGKFLTSLPTRSGDKTATPVDVVVDRAAKHIYVSITKPFHNILVFGEGAGKGEVTATWGKPGSNLGEFRFPATLAVGPEKNIYIVDVFNSRVQVFRESGQAVVTVGSWGITPGRLFRPKGIAIRKDGLIAVSDSYLEVIQFFDSDTRFKAVLGEQGEFAHFTTPTGLAMDERGRLYIAEMLANKVTVVQLEH